jgi:hypothetical protein
MSNQRNNPVNVRKGRKAEIRAKSIAESLLDVLPINEVRMAPHYLDHQGIDLIIEICEGSEIVRVPLQIKSSPKYEEIYKRKHSDLVKFGIIILVVNKSRSDDLLRQELILALSNLDTLKTSFAKLFEQVESKLQIQEVRLRQKQLLETQHHNNKSKVPIICGHNKCTGEHLLEKFISDAEKITKLSNYKASA